MDRFWSAPPVSRTLVAATAIQSALFYSGTISDYYLFWSNELVYQFPPELWRMVTCFLLTGGGISFVIDLYFRRYIKESSLSMLILAVWIYSTGLELNSPRFSQPGDFFTYVVFLASIILVLGGVMLKAGILMSALMLGFIYTFAQDNRGTKAHFIILQIPVEFLPWAMLGLTFVMGGPTAAMIQGSGIIAAHLYDFLTRLYPQFQGGRNWVQTPTFIKRLFGANRTSSTRKAYGTSFRPGQHMPQQQSGGWTSSFSSDGWTGRGQGRRLGGN